MTRRSFLQHIQKHWVDANTALILTAAQLNASYGRKSGLVAYSMVQVGLIAAEQAINDLIAAYNLDSLKILVNNGRELTISTEGGLLRGEAKMFKMARTKFSQNISSVFSIERCETAGALRPITVTLDINQIIRSRQNTQKFGTNKAEEITFYRQQQAELEFFFKFTIPHDIQTTGAIHGGVPAVLAAPINFALPPISNRIDNMGSFYVRN